MCTLHKALYKQNSLENVSFNGIAQSAIKICQSELLKVPALKDFTKGPMNCFIRKAPYAKLNNYGNMFSKEIAQSIAKIYRLKDSTPTETSPRLDLRLTLSRWALPQRTLSDRAIPQPDYCPKKTSPTECFSHHDVLLKFSLVLRFCRITGDI